MRAGRLRYVVTIQTRTDTMNSVGEPVPAWSDVARRSAEITQTGGAENIRGRQLAALITDIVEIRHTPGVRPRMRVLVPNGAEARTLDIAFVIDPTGRRREMILDCTEVL